MAPVSGTVWISESENIACAGREVDDEVIEVSPTTSRGIA